MIKSFFDPEFGLRRCAIGADAVFDGDAATFILAERRVNDPLLRSNMAVDDGEIFLGDGAGFPDFAEFASGDGIFRQQNNAAGFAI